MFLPWISLVAHFTDRKSNYSSPSKLHEYMLFSEGPISAHASIKPVGQPRKYLCGLFFLCGHIQLLLILPFELPHLSLLFLPTATNPHHEHSILTSVLNLSHPFCLHNAVRAIFQNCKNFNLGFPDWNIFPLKATLNLSYFPFSTFPDMAWTANYYNLELCKYTTWLLPMPFSQPGVL